MGAAGAGQPPASNCKTLLRSKHQVDMKSRIQVVVSFFLPHKTTTVRIHCPLLGDSLSRNAVNCEQRWEMTCFGLGFQGPPRLRLLREQTLLWPTSLYKPAFMQLRRQRGGGIPKANEKNSPVNALLLRKHKGRRLRRCQTRGCFGVAAEFLAKETHALCLVAFYWKDSWFPPKTVPIPRGGYLRKPHS